MFMPVSTKRYKFEWFCLLKSRDLKVPFIVCEAFGSACYTYCIIISKVTKMHSTKTLVPSFHKHVGH